MCCPINILSNVALERRLDQPVLMNTNAGWKTCEIGARQGANHSQVRPRYGGAGAGITRSRGPACGDATVKPAEARGAGPCASPGSHPSHTPRWNLLRPATRPLVGMRPGSGMQAHRDAPRSCAHLRGRIPRGAPAPRSGAHTWRGFATQHGVDSRQVFGKLFMGQHTSMDRHRPCGSNPAAGRTRQ